MVSVHVTYSGTEENLTTWHFSCVTLGLLPVGYTQNSSFRKHLGGVRVTCQNQWNWFLLLFAHSSIWIQFNHIPFFSRWIKLSLFHTRLFLILLAIMLIIHQITDTGLSSFWSWVWTLQVHSHRYELKLMCPGEESVCDLINRYVWRMYDAQFVW